MEIIKNIVAVKSSSTAVELKAKMQDLFNNYDIEKDGIFLDKTTMLRGRKIDSNKTESFALANALNSIRSNATRYCAELSNQHKVSVLIQRGEDREIEGVLIKFRKKGV